MKKLMCIVMTMLLVVGLFAGCATEATESTEQVDSANKEANGSEQDSAEITKKEGEKTKIVIDLDKLGVDAPEMIAAVETVKTMEKYANVEIEVLAHDPEYRTTLPIAISAGEQRDILCVRAADWLKEWSDAEIIQPIDTFAATAGVDYKETYGEYTADCTVDGKIMAVPNAVNQWVLYYNKEVFDNAGVSYPDAEVPMTWEDYTALAAKLTSGEGENKIYGALEVNWPQFWYGEALITAGGTDVFYTEDGLASNIENPVFTKCLEAKYQRMHTDESIPTYADVATSKIQVNAFMNGKYGMIVQGGWMLDWLGDETNYPRDWKAGIAPMPVDAGTDLKTWGSVNYLTIGQTSVDPQLAFEIAKDIEDTFCATTTVTNANRLLDQPNIFVKPAAALAGDDITLEMILYLFDNNEVSRYAEKIIGKNSQNYIKVMNEETELYFVKEQEIGETISNIKERGDKAIQKD